MAIEPGVRGEAGYVDWCILLLEAGLCCCDWCGGHMVDGRCISCGCGHEISEPTRFHRHRGVATYPVRERGRCAHADAVRAQQAREYEQQRRKRWTAEELGDPQR